MNLSVIELGLSILVIPQFTLMGDVRRGYRPSFSEAELPEIAEAWFHKFIAGRSRSSWIAVSLRAGRGG